MRAIILSNLFLSFIVLYQSNWVLKVEAFPPPAKFDGFVLGSPKKFNPNSIVIEAFFDPLCPDSRDAWPPLKKVLHFYGPKVSLTVHPFPLPYHDNAFISSRAIHIVNELNSSVTYHLWESFFEGQERFYNDETKNFTRTDILDHVVDFVTRSVGHAFHSALKTGLKTDDSDLKTRVSFKYACSRGVLGTPTFFVNGFALPDAGSALDYKGWKKVLDPLVHPKTTGHGRHHH